MAILAANPHDGQAWVCRTTPSRTDVFADRRRALGAIDPFDHEPDQVDGGVRLAGHP